MKCQDVKTLKDVKLTKINNNDRSSANTKTNTLFKKNHNIHKHAANDKLSSSKPNLNKIIEEKPSIKKDLNTSNFSHNSNKHNISVISQHVGGNKKIYLYEAGAHFQYNYLVTELEQLLAKINSGIQQNQTTNKKNIITQDNNNSKSFMVTYSTEKSSENDNTSSKENSLGIVFPNSTRNKSRNKSNTIKNQNFNLEINSRNNNFNKKHHLHTVESVPSDYKSGSFLKKPENKLFNVKYSKFDKNNLTKKEKTSIVNCNNVSKLKHEKKKESNEKIKNKLNKYLNFSIRDEETDNDKKHNKRHSSYNKPLKFSNFNKRVDNYDKKIKLNNVNSNMSSETINTVNTVQTENTLKTSSPLKNKSPSPKKVFSPKIRDYFKTNAPNLVKQESKKRKPFESIIIKNRKKDKDPPQAMPMQIKPKSPQSIEIQNKVFKKTTLNNKECGNQQPSIIITDYQFTNRQNLNISDLSIDAIDVSNEGENIFFEKMEKSEPVTKNSACISSCKFTSKIEREKKKMISINNQINNLHDKIKKMKISLKK